MWGDGCVSQSDGGNLGQCIAMYSVSNHYDVQLYMSVIPPLSWRKRNEKNNALLPL